MKLNTHVRKPTKAELELLERHILEHEEHKAGSMIPGTHEEFLTHIQRFDSSYQNFQKAEILYICHCLIHKKRL